MSKWLKIALRNIIKNRRRSLVTILAISTGFAAVSLFQGYTANTFEGIRESAIRGEGLGHLTIYKKDWLSKGNLDPYKYMHSKKEIEEIISIIEEDDDTLLATPKLHISGLVSNGDVSTIFLAVGVIPRDDKTIKGAFASVRPVNGQIINDNKSYGVEMARDLAVFLDMVPGKNGIVMASTLDGQMNALDIEVAGIYDTGIPATNDKYLRFPLEHAQSLYDTDKAESIVVLLDNWRNTESARQRFFMKLQEAGFDCEIKTWNELSQFYTKVKGMMDMIFLFLFFIVFVIVIMSVINTMGMAVLERTREIGTLRALGLKQRGVGFLFATEGILIGLIGSIFGLIINIAIWAIIQLAGPTYIPPGVSSPVPLEVQLVPQAMMFLVIFLMLLSFISAILPARRAAKQNVVMALGHV